MEPFIYFLFFLFCLFFLLILFSMFMSRETTILSKAYENREKDRKKRKFKPKEVLQRKYFPYFRVTIEFDDGQILLPLHIDCTKLPWYKKPFFHRHMHIGMFKVVAKKQVPPKEYKDLFQ